MSAYKLSKSKFRCAIVEKNTIGSGATQAAAGIISPLFYGDINLSDTLNTPMFKLRKLSFDSFLTLGEELAELDISSPYNKTGILRVAYNEEELKTLDPKEDKEEIIEGELKCNNCSEIYPINDGIPNLLTTDLQG